MKEENDLIEFRVKRVGDLIARLVSYAKSEGLNVVIGSKDQFVRLENIDNVIISEDEISLEDIREATEAAAFVRAEMGMGIQLKKENSKRDARVREGILAMAELFGIELPEGCDGDCANCKIERGLANASEYTSEGLIAEA